MTLYWKFEEVAKDQIWHLAHGGRFYFRHEIEVDDELTVANKRTDPLVKPIPVEVESLIKRRQQAKQVKDFNLADKLRDEIQGLTGKRLIDKPGGDYVLI